jgi:hypothetical protein
MACTARLIPLPAAPPICVKFRHPSIDRSGDRPIWIKHSCGWSKGTVGNGLMDQLAHLIPDPYASPMQSYQTGFPGDAFRHAQFGITSVWAQCRASRSKSCTCQATLHRVADGSKALHHQVRPGSRTLPRPGSPLIPQIRRLSISTCPVRPPPGLARTIDPCKV